MILHEKKFKLAEVAINRYVMPFSINEKLADLKRRGYEFKFKREATYLYCIEPNRWITSDIFIVDEYYYFEDTSNTD